MAVLQEVPRYDGPVLTSLEQLVDATWQIDRLCDLEGTPHPYPLYNMFGTLASPQGKDQGEHWLAETLAHLLDSVDGKVSELTRHAALLYFRPSSWIEPYTFDYSQPEKERLRQAARGSIMQLVLSEWIRLHTNVTSRALLTERMATLLGGQGTKWKPDLYRPTLKDCIDMLFEDRSVEATEVLAQLAAGALGSARPGTVEEPELRLAVPAIYLRLWDAHRFTYDDFRTAMYSLPGAFHDLSVPIDSASGFFRNLPAGFTLELQSYVHKLTLELAEKLADDDIAAANLLKQVAYLEGATWLLMACAYVEEKALPELPSLETDLPAAAATRLCATQFPVLLHEDEQQTLAFLHQYKPETLRVVLPHTGDYLPLVEQALG
ncbi:MAG TPA: hypothetical protein VH186_17105 [Chloroflexia bacterium]|nr:hypothetical protein [Chloroflexia bacterium]